MTQLAISVADHQRQLERLEALPRPLNWQDVGSLAYHAEAIRAIRVVEARRSGL